MLLEILPKYSASEIIGYLKGKSSLMIFDRHDHLNINMEIEIFGVEDIM